MEPHRLKRNLAWLAGVAMAASWLCGVVSLAVTPGTYAAPLFLALTVLLPVPAAGAAAAVVSQATLRLPWPAGTSEWRIVGGGAGLAASAILLGGAAMAATAPWGEEYWLPALLVSAVVWASGIYALHRKILPLPALRSAAASGLFLAVSAVSLAVGAILWPALVQLTGKPLSDNLRLAIGNNRGDAAVFRWGTGAQTDRAASDESFFRGGGRWLIASEPTRTPYDLARGSRVRVGPGRSGLVFLHYSFDPAPQSFEDNYEYSLFLEIPAASGGPPPARRYGPGEFDAAVWHWALGAPKDFTPLRPSEATLELSRFDGERASGRLAGTFTGAVQQATPGPVADRGRTMDVDVSFNVERRTFPHTRFARSGQRLSAAVSRWTAGAVEPERRAAAAAPGAGTVAAPPRGDRDAP